MNDMIDRVAEAIAINGNGGTWDDWYNEDQKEFHRKRARAAIKALREPTEAMIARGEKCFFEYRETPAEWTLLATKEAWLAMVDEALK